MAVSVTPVIMPESIQITEHLGRLNVFLVQTLRDLFDGQSVDQLIPHAEQYIQDQLDQNFEPIYRIEILDEDFMPYGEFSEQVLVIVHPRSTIQ